MSVFAQTVSPTKNVDRGVVQSPANVLMVSDAGIGKRDLNVDGHDNRVGESDAVRELTLPVFAAAEVEPVMLLTLPFKDELESTE